MPARSTRTLNVLFLCTGNSARSLIAEALVNSLPSDRLRAFSAGSRPAGAAHPLALEILESSKVSVEGLRSKPIAEFSAEGAPKMDFVITLCDSAAQECPVWPGEAIRAHWGIKDPAATKGDEAQRRAFARVYGELQDRLLVFASLPLDKLERKVLERRIQEIGELGAGEPEGPSHLVDRIRAASRPLKRSLLSRTAGRR